MTAPGLEEAKAKAAEAERALADARAAVERARQEEAVAREAEREAAAFARAEKLKGKGEIRVTRDALLGALRSVVKVVPSRSTLPITRFAHLEASGGRATLRGTDLDTELTAEFACETPKPLSTLIEARSWLRFAAAMPAGDVAIVRKDGQLTVIAGEGIELTVNWADPAEFVSPREFAVGQLAEYCGSEFRQQVERVTLAVATDDSRPVLTGVYLDAERGVWVATDGFRLTTLSMEPLEGELEATLFPAAVLRLAARHVRSDEKVIVEVNELRTSCRITVGAITLVAVVIQGTFPNYAQLVPPEWTTRVTLNAAAVRSALRLLAPLAEDGSGILRIEAKKAGTKLWTRSDELGAGAVTLLAPVEGEDQRIAFNCRYLVDAMALFDGEFTLEFTAPSAQGVMRPAGKASPTHVLMPMYVQW